MPGRCGKKPERRKTGRSATHLDGVMRIAVASTSPRPRGPMALDGQGHASPPAISPTRPTLHTIPSQMRRAKCMHCVESTGVVPCSSSDEQHVVAVATAVARPARAAQRSRLEASCALLPARGTAGIARLAAAKAGASDAAVRRHAGCSTLGAESQVATLPSAAAAPPAPTPPQCCARPSLAARAPKSCIASAVGTPTRDLLLWAGPVGRSVIHTWRTVARGTPSR